MKIANLTRKNYIARQAVYVVRFRDRLCGMIGKDFSTFDGMIFDRCNAIHTFFMKIPLDVLFLSSDYQVLKIVQNFPVWRPFLYCKNAFYVIELPVGAVSVSGTKEGDLLDLAGVLSSETEKKQRKNNRFQSAENISASLKIKDKS